MEEEQVITAWDVAVSGEKAAMYRYRNSCLVVREFAMSAAFQSSEVTATMTDRRCRTWNREWFIQERFHHHGIMKV